MGERCGFDGRGHHAHKVGLKEDVQFSDQVTSLTPPAPPRRRRKGFLARSKWIINDLKKRMVLDKLYEVGSPYENFGVVVCGHSLGVSRFGRRDSCSAVL